MNRTTSCHSQSTPGVLVIRILQGVHEKLFTGLRFRCRADHANTIGKAARRFSQSRFALIRKWHFASSFSLSTRTPGIEINVPSSPKQAAHAPVNQVLQLSAFSFHLRNSVDLNPIAMAALITDARLTIHEPGGGPKKQVRCGVVPNITPPAC